MSEVRPAHWLYPVNAKTDSRIHTLGGLEPVSLDGLRRLDFSRQVFWGLASGYRSMREGDLLWVYLTRPDSAIGALGKVAEVRSDASGEGYEAVLVWDEAVTRSLLETPIALATIGRAPRSVRRAHSDAVVTLQAWLGEHQPADATT